VATIQQQQALAGKSRAVLEKEKEQQLRAKEKAEEEKQRKEAAALLKPAQTQKIPLGVDPKTILCAFFKAGNCEKGNKCKFSHNLDVERKVEKRNLYDDGKDESKGVLSVSLTSFYSSSRRHHGGLGRGEVEDSGTVETRKPTDNYRRLQLLFLLGSGSYHTFRSSASSLLRRLNHRSRSSFSHHPTTS
jgi:hypothetical protein